MLPDNNSCVGRQLSELSLFLVCNSTSLSLRLWNDSAVALGRADEVTMKQYYAESVRALLIRTDRNGLGDVSAANRRHGEGSAMTLGSLGSGIIATQETSPADPIRYSTRVLCLKEVGYTRIPDAAKWSRYHFIALQYLDVPCEMSSWREAKVRNIFKLTCP